MARVISKHSNLLNYFIHDRRDLSPAYVKSCEKFFKSLKPQAASRKLQAASATKRTQLKCINNLERNKL